MDVTPSQIDTFEDLGFVVLRQVVPAELIARLNAAIDIGAAGPGGADFCWAEARGARSLIAMNNLHRHLAPASLALTGLPGVRAIGTALCGEDHVIVSERLVVKQPDDGQTIGWHRDMIHDRTSRVATVGVYLTASRADDGGVHFVPGSQYAPQAGEPSAATASADLDAGDILVHDVMTLHGSAPLGVAGRRLTLYFEIRARDHVEANPRFSAAWLATRDALQAAADAAYGRWAEGDHAGAPGERGLVEAAYAVPLQIEPAHYAGIPDFTDAPATAP